MKGEGSICTVFPPALSGNGRGTYFIAVAQCQKMNLVSVLIKSHHSVIRLPGEHGRFPTAGRLFLWISEFLQTSLYGDVLCSYTAQTTMKKLKLTT